ncbi:MAG: heavy-metal-associated domain-containing protein [Paenibacillus sp.]|uniref:Copper chaperone n=1 Tax=Paenibacillus aquistagni TaxID=1852522 RepID=A0A1X7LBM8_9BACL|nr:cation transporter [Paenibacillus aquistagni]MBR2570215.1 heavy-metal-associated domain-containing protein [Paenibacillus sp.]SMG50803.1 copper chaperone [Paenibacillus aquistagni]
MTNVVLKVNGMSCNHCVNSIEGALKEIGVEGKVDLGEGTVAVAFDENQLTLDAVKEVIEDQGYDVA